MDSGAFCPVYRPVIVLRSTGVSLSSELLNDTVG